MRDFETKCSHINAQNSRNTKLFRLLGSAERPDSPRVACRDRPESMTVARLGKVQEFLRVR